MKVYIVLAALAFTVTGKSIAQAVSAIYPIELTCEQLDNPTAVDIPQPRFSWKLAATDPSGFAQKQKAYRILVSSTKNLLNSNTGDIWDSGWRLSDETLLIPFRGTTLGSDRDYYWKVQVKDDRGIIATSKATAQFSTGLFDQQEWKAKWIGTDEVYDPYKGSNKMPDPWFRKSFELDAAPERAVLFVASVGYHEVYVNGKKIGNYILAPAVTDHTQRARYLAYDIAAALQPGRNVIGLWLGTSWSIFAPYATADKPRTPLVIAQAKLWGKSNQLITSIKTDETWKTHPGPSQLIGNWGFIVGGYGGELFDANKDIPEWNSVTYNDQSWSDASVFTPKLKLSAQQVETNIAFDEIHPIAVEHRNDGSYRVDMGINFAGWIQVHLKGNPGDTVRLLVSERAQNDMTFGLHNIYILGPTGEGIFKNRFNYNSGRWFTIQGVQQPIRKEDIKGWMVRTNYKSATSFECSDDLQNWIYNTVRWTFENLSLGGFIVDCPQRERFGYGGDAHATSETGLLNYRMGAFYSKWLQDWRDVQGTEPMVGNMNDTTWAHKKEGSGRHLGGGILPQTAPTYHGGGGPAWGGIVVTLPWFLYEYLGDKRVLQENFEMIKGWIAFLQTHVNNNMLQRYGGKWDFLGDWLWPHANEQGMNNYSNENLFFNNCYWIYNLKTAAKVARVIGKTREAAQWERQAKKGSEAIHTRYYHAAGHNYSDNSMRSLAAALYGDVMPANLRPLVMRRLEKEILVNKNGHIDAGITGGAMLFKVLREEGRDDLLYAMTSQTTYPGWGFMRDNNATTIWEMWEKDLPGHSMLHSSYLYPGAWYIDGIAGIKRDDRFPGYKQFSLRVPKLNENQLSWAKADFDSPSGKISAHWKKENGKTVYEVTIPPNGKATVYFPDESGKTIRVNSAYAKKTGIKNGYTIYEVPAGKYRFEN